MEINFETVKLAFEELLQNGVISSEKFKDMLQYTGKSKYAIEKEQQRAFKAIVSMYNIKIDSFLKSNALILKKRGSLSFVLDGYRLCLNNNSELAQKDLILRFQYIKVKDEIIKKQLLNLIIENIEDALIAIESFKTIEKDKKVKLINESILENKQIQIVTNNNKTLIINPIKIYFHSGYWYLAAIFEDGNSELRIRIDNIVNISLLEKEISIEKTILADYRTYEYDAWGHEKSKKNCKIILKLNDVNIYNFFKVKKFKVNQKAYVKDDEFFVEFEFDSDWEIAPLIFSWMDVITIVDLECQDGKEEELLKSLYNSMKNFITKKEHKEFFGEYSFDI